MKRLARVAVVCLCALAPATARADDGGWWDNFWKFDAHFMGVGTDFHAFCYGKDADGKSRRIRGCEEWFRNIPKLWKGGLPEHDFNYGTRVDGQVEYLDNLKDIKSELTLRVGYYQNRGARYKYDENHPDDAVYGYIGIERFMALEYWYPKPSLAIGAGGGLMLIHGDRFNAFTRGVITGSVVAYPPAANALFIRFEVNSIPAGFRSEEFGDPPGLLNKDHEVNFTIAVGFDLRRVGRFHVAR